MPRFCSCRISGAHKIFYDKNNYLLNRFSLRTISESKLADADRKLLFGPAQSPLQAIEMAEKK
jgi:hypothetical protein